MGDALETARELLRNITPLRLDCGKRCGNTCCKGGQEDGMLLFPGEERYYDHAPWAKIKKDRLGLKLVCGGMCERDLRPLSCRIFPLVIHAERQEENNIKANIVMDIRGWPVCPLMGSGLIGLRTEFVDAVLKASKLLLQEDKHRLFLLMLGEELERYEEMKRSFLSGRDEGCGS